MSDINQREAALKFKRAKRQHVIKTKQEAEVEDQRYASSCIDSPQLWFVKKPLLWKVCCSLALMCSCREKAIEHVKEQLEHTNDANSLSRLNALLHKLHALDNKVAVQALLICLKH